MHGQKSIQIPRERAAERSQVVRECRWQCWLTVRVQRKDRLEVTASQPAQHSQKFDQFSNQGLIRCSQLKLQKRRIDIVPAPTKM